MNGAFPYVFFGKEEDMSKKSNQKNRNTGSIFSFNSRILQISLIFGLCMTLSVGTIGYTMISKKHLWSGTSVLNPAIYNSIVREIDPGSRGQIFSRKGEAIATTAPAYTITANFDNRTEEQRTKDDRIIQGQRNQALDNAALTGRTEQVTAWLETSDSENAGTYVEDKKAFAKAVKDVLGDSVNEENVLKLLEDGENNCYAQIELGTGTKRITAEQKERLAAMKIPGMGFIDDTRRSYPITPFSSQAIGFAAYNDYTSTLTGRYGLEQSLNAYLASKNGITTYSASRGQTKLPGSEVVIQDKEDGDDVTLTIDLSLQQTVETVLEQTMDTGLAQQAWAIVINPKTGEILAWGSAPTFDQNMHLELPESADNISQRPMEPGSVVKPLVYAAAIDSGVYPSDDTTYRAGFFSYVVNPTNNMITRISREENTQYPTIRDALGTDYGVLTFADGLAHSSNIAICELLSNYLDQPTFNKYLDAFKLFEPVGTPFIREQIGIRNTSNATDYLSTGFGQASSMSVLALCQAYTAIFNDGKMMKPYIVDSISDPATGKILQKFKPECVGYPITASTAKKVRELMVGVGGEGMTGERFTIDGIDIALKTGTGEIFNLDQGGYDKTNYTSTVVGAAPADDPQVMVLWGMQGPNYLGYSGDYFKDIMKAAIQAAGVNMKSAQEEVNTQEGNSGWKTYDMPSLVSHSVTYANEKMASKDSRTVILGDGDTIVDQYPKAGASINSNDTILLLTNSQTITMPDMTGWTRKDLTAFWHLTGIQVINDGFGTVISQSIPAGTVIPAGEAIEVKLWQQNSIKNSDDDSQEGGNTDSSQSSASPQQINPSADS